jgi:hypothetical protein
VRVGPIWLTKPHTPAASLAHVRTASAPWEAPAAANTSR